MAAPMMAFTTPQAVKLTGLSARTISRWESQGVFRASYVDDRPRKAYRRFYSFRDIVSLRTLHRLRRDHRIPLNQLRRVGEYLQSHTSDPWSSISFRTVGRSVEFIDPASGVLVSSQPFGQGVFSIELSEIALETETEATALIARDPSDIGRIVRHRHTMANSWVLAGTRIPTSAIWNFHEGGATLERIRQAYPDLTAQDIKCAIEHEAAVRAVA